MKVTVATRHCELTPADQEMLDRHVAQLERRLWHINPDLIHLTLVIEPQARRDEYKGSVRLVIFNRALPAKRNTAPTIGVLIKRSFEDLEDQVDRFEQQLRGEYAHERKRASLTPEEREACEQLLLKERELFDRALAGDSAAFNALADAELPAVSQVIARALLEQGQEVGPETIAHVLGDVLTIAHENLARKPARWTLGGWLAWTARRVVKDEARGRALAQSVEQPAHGA
jgi:ribosome-associated translation inhibitor RaiA